MKLREKELEKLKTYEKNLQSHIELEKSNLETILRVSMPNQLSNIKTILWINLVIIGLSLSIFYKLPFNMGVMFIWIFSFASIALNNIALLGKRYKIYPLLDINYTYDLYDNKQSRTITLGQILSNIKYAIDENLNVLSWISKFMHISLYLTLCSIFSFFVYIGIATFQLKEDGWQKIQLHPKNLMFHQKVKFTRED